MGTPDNKLSELVDFVKSWIPRRSEALTVSRDFWMPDQSCRVCYECDSQFTIFNRRHHCRICGRVFCARCTSNSIPAPSDKVQTSCEDLDRIKVCAYCFKQWERGVETVDNGAKIHTPILSPSPSTTSLASTQSSTGNSGTSTIGSTPYSTGPYQRISHTSVHSPVHAKQMDLNALEQDDVTLQRSMQRYADFVDPSSDPYNFCITRSDDEDDDYAIFPSDSDSRQYGILGLDVIDHTYEPYDCHPNEDRTDGKDASHSPSVDSSVTQGVDGTKEPQGEVGEPTHSLHDGTLKHNQEEADTEPVDFENTGLLWLPPEPEDEEDEREAAMFDDDDGECSVGEWGYLPPSDSFNREESRNKDKSNEEHKKAMKNVVEGHFRALIAQLLQAGNLPVSGEAGKQSWLDIISSLSWEAATLLKPDTSKGGGMDPGGYVKVKCIASGFRDESKVVKGVVCKKNVAHRRMTTKIEKPRLLILGGALEYQRVANHLSSFHTLLQQEKDHLKMAVAKIDAHHPNVLLVEKSVSRHAQEYLLAKDISLVLNIKRPLLERIARCTGAQIVSSIDHLNSPKLGYCETFHVDRFLEDHGSAGQGGKKLTKTLMFFEGCPKPLAYTILLKGANGDELKKVKHVVQYGVFAAYHLALETSFLADEGASLPELPLKSPITVALPDKPSSIERSISMIPGFHVNSQVQSTDSQAFGDSRSKDLQSERSASAKAPPSGTLEETKLRSFPESHRPENAYEEFALGYMNSMISFQSSSESWQGQFYLNDNALLSNNAFDETNGVGAGESNSAKLANKVEDWNNDNAIMKAFGNSGSPGVGNSLGDGIALASIGNSELATVKEDGNNLNGEVGSLKEEFPPSSNDHRSILVSSSTRCVWKGAVCERAHLLRIKYYGSFDKPLGRFLRDELFDQNYHCHSCDMPSEAHVRCYTHRQGSLTISVKKLPEIVLPGQREGKIWMWHRCLRCPRKSGIPQATRRVVMSDAAWGLSFGKFLELSFSNHAAASRVASCGHSLHRDCLRFYGFGNMVACFSYASIDLNSIYLPPPKLEFNYDNQGWIQKEANEVHEQAELLFSEVHNVVNSMIQQLPIAGSQDGGVKAANMKFYIEEMEKMLFKEREEFEELYQKAVSREVKVGRPAIDILEINSLRRLLLIHSYVCDQRLIRAFNSACNNRQETLNNSAVKSKDKTINSVEILVEMKAASDPTKMFISGDASLQENKSNINPIHTIGTMGDIEQDLNSGKAAAEVFLSTSESNYKTEPQSSGKIVRRAFSDGEFLVMKDLSDTLDAVWTGEGHPPILVSGEKAALAPTNSSTVTDSIEGKTDMEALNALQNGRGAVIPDTALPPKGHLSANRPNDVNLAFPNFYSSFSTFSLNPQKLGIGEYNPVYVRSFWESERLSGARLLLPVGCNDTIVPIYDDEPTSIISYALVSSDYHAQIFNTDRPKDTLGSSNSLPLFDSLSLLSFNSFSENAWDPQKSNGSSEESISSSSGSRIQQVDPLLAMGDFHARVTFTDDCFLGKAKYVVTCYYAKQFEALRRMCYPSELDFVRSLSRCKKWGAQGGKSNVFFAKTLDERFIIKQVTKTELESFLKFAPAYFKYLSESIGSGSPTCLAKILGIYQVSSKHLKGGGKESKMDVLVIENLLFRRNITRLYDLKGSSRSRYNADTSGNNKVLLDQNLIEAMPTSPIFVGNKAKRLLERAVWNDTSFLASIAVMDYSLLVGVDEEKHELVLGIIDFMRQYTWDKHLETWVKTAGILGGSRNTTPTVISPQMYKRRFRKAMSTYFVMVPEWSPPTIIPSHSQADLCEDDQ